MSDRLVAKAATYATQYKHKRRHIEAVGGIWTHEPRSQAASDLPLEGTAIWIGLQILLVLSNKNDEIGEACSTNRIYWTWAQGFLLKTQR